MKHKLLTAILTLSAFVFLSTSVHAYTWVTETTNTWGHKVDFTIQPVAASTASVSQPLTLTKITKGWLSGYGFSSASDDFDVSIRDKAGSVENTNNERLKVETINLHEEADKTSINSYVELKYGKLWIKVTNDDAVDSTGYIKGFLVFNPQ